MAENNEKLNIAIIEEKFRQSLIKKDDIDMDNYLLAFKELYKFFQLTGKLLSFVGDDVKSKIGILHALREGESGEHYATFMTMITYEKENNLLKKDGFVSGSRTLLRLHRGLEFIKLFLKRISEVNGDDKTSIICQTVYDETLSKHHHWLIRKGAKVGMYTLPKRDELLEKVVGLDGIQNAIVVLPTMLDLSQAVWERTEEMYSREDLHSLP